ncbi:MAG: hypothetical protein KAX49_18940 [Halanaerobiales bacterium]|nr:hypothetical protein [Halanaerobiales bacterium]
MDRVIKEQWKQRIADYKSSGQTGKVWCEANNLNINTLRYYTSKFNNENRSTIETSKTETPTKWVQVDASIPEQEIKDTALVISIGKASIKVNPNFDPEFLKEVVRTISSVC